MLWDMGGLRARKKRRTREQLAGAALELFLERGFEATTVDDIVERVEVSRSTFFRYFATKEHVLFADHEEQLRAFRRELASTPTTLPPFEVIRSVALDASNATIEAFRRDPEAYRARQQVIASAPSVQALALRLDIDWEDALSEALERRLPGPRQQLRARLLAGSLMGAVSAFHRLWESTGFARDPAEYRDDVMTVFEHGLAGVLAGSDESRTPAVHGTGNSTTTHARGESR